MANEYKFYGKSLSSTAETSLIQSGSNETIIVKSLRVTNNTANTPSISFDVNDNAVTTDFTIINTKSLSANNSEELLNQPLVLESSDSLKTTVSSTDNVHISISYLSIT